MKSQDHPVWTWILAVLAFGTLANAAWMLIDPLRWYHDLPAAVPDFGVFNPHFVRDIGCAYLTAGIALAWAARRIEWRVPLVGSAAIFFVAHAILHVHDILRGLVDSHHWWIDFPGVMLPAIVTSALAIHFKRGPSPRSTSRENGS
jgi:hypothetical protein